MRRLCVQIMPELDAEKTPCNPFDVTKVWPHGDHPLIEVGIVELNRNPEHYFAEIGQSSFSPSNIVPGIGFSPDKMLQGRIFAYADAHRYRVGTHYEALPVNAPRVQARTCHADGSMRFDAPKRARMRATSRTRSTARSNSPARRSRRCASAAALARTHLPAQSGPVAASATPVPAPTPAGALAAD